MIGKISGILEYRSVDHVLIDVRGVGYLVYCSERTLAALPGVGQAVALYTDLLVREDVLQLFGFTTLVEKEWHRLLTSVQGIAGAVMGLIAATWGWRFVASLKPISPAQLDPKPAPAYPNIDRYRRR